MPKILDNIVYLEFDYLIEAGIPSVTIKMGLVRNRENAKSWQHITDPQDGRKRLINYDTIPETTLKKYNIPSKVELVTKNQQKEQIEQLEMLIKREIRIFDLASEFFTTQKESHSIARQYARLAFWMLKTAPYSTSTARKEGYKNLDALYQSVLEAIRMDKGSLPKCDWENTRTLGKKIAPFASLGEQIPDCRTALTYDFKEALNSLINKHNTTKTAYKLTDLAQKVLINLYANKGSDVKMLSGRILVVYDSIRLGKKTLVDSDTGEILVDQSNCNELKPLSDRTIDYFLALPSTQQSADRLRHGYKYYNENYMIHTHGEKPKYALSMVTADGEVVPFRLIVKNKLTYDRALAYLIFDVASEAIIGMALDTSENMHVMAEAVKDMVLFLDGKIPQEIQLDNFGQAFKETLKLSFPFVSFCLPYNSQAKYAENYIGRIEAEQCRNYEGWTGGNIQDRKQNQKRNSDVEQVGYTFDQIKQMYAKIRRDWNNTVPEWNKKDGRTRLEVLKGTINESARTLTEIELAQLIGERREIKIQRSHLDIEVDGIDYSYFINDYTTEIYSLRDWTVSVVLLKNKLREKVWIYTLDGRYLTDGTWIDPVQRSKHEQTEADKDKTAEQMRRKAEITSFVDTKESEMHKIAIVDNMSYESAEAILANGYTEKHLMHQAEAAIIGKTNAQLKPNRKVDKRVAKAEKVYKESVESTLWNMANTVGVMLQEEEKEEMKGLDLWDL